MTGSIQFSVQPLCRRYLLVLIQTLSAPCNEPGGACDRNLAWGLGVVADGRYEPLGVWAVDDADVLEAVLADLRFRGVERIRQVLAPWSSGEALVSARRMVLASQYVADEFQRLACAAVRRHGPFETAADAVSFIAGVLRRAEERLGDVSLEQAAGQCAGRVRRRTSGRIGAMVSLTC